MGNYERYGLKSPNYGFLQAHPTTSDTILSRLTHGDIFPKPAISGLHGNRVCFVDGSEEEADVIVYCTGYRITFPFFDATLVSAPDNELSLYVHTFHPDIDNLAFIGFVQPLGAIPPCAEAQSKLVGDYVAGLYALPSRAEMQAAIAR